MVGIIFLAPNQLAIHHGKIVMVECYELCLTAARLYVITLATNEYSEPHTRTICVFIDEATFAVHLINEEKMATIGFALLYFDIELYRLEFVRVHGHVSFGLSPSLYD